MYADSKNKKMSIVKFFLITQIIGKIESDAKVPGKKRILPIPKPVQNILEIKITFFRNSYY